MNVSSRIIFADRYRKQGLSDLETLEPGYC